MSHATIADRPSKENVKTGASKARVVILPHRGSRRAGLIAENGSKRKTQPKAMFNSSCVNRNVRVHKYMRTARAARTMRHRTGFELGSDGAEPHMCARSLKLRFLDRY